MTAIIKVFTSVKGSYRSLSFSYLSLSLFRLLISRLLPYHVLFFFHAMHSLLDPMHRPAQTLKVSSQRNTVDEFAGSCINWLRLQHEDHVVQKIVRLSQVTFAEIRQFAPDKTSKTDRSENPVDQSGYLGLESVSSHRQILRRFVITPLADLDVGTERQYQSDDQPAARSQRGSQ